MNKRTAAAGIVAIGIAIGMYLNGWFKGAGTGSDGDSGTASTTTPGEATRDDEDRRMLASTITETSADAPRESNTVLEVIVADDSYELRGNGGTLEPVELGRVIDLAKETTPDDSGIRVRIFKRKSSLPTAEITLKNALELAGLPEQSIHWEEELLD